MHCTTLKKKKMRRPDVLEDAELLIEVGKFVTFVKFAGPRIVWTIILMRFRFFFSVKGGIKKFIVSLDREKNLFRSIAIYENI
jgi:hypothetical protein